VSDSARVAARAIIDMALLPAVAQLAPSSEQVVEMGTWVDMPYNSMATCAHGREEGLCADG
jgi:hypothetical protein